MSEKTLEPIHVLAIVLLIFIVYEWSEKHKNEKYGNLPRYTPMDAIYLSRARIINPYTHGIQYSSSMCNIHKNNEICNSKINCKWNNNKCNYYSKSLE